MGYDEQEMTPHWADEINAEFQKVLMTNAMARKAWDHSRQFSGLDENDRLKCVIISLADGG